MVQAGITEKGIAWAFTTTEALNWFPLTRLSEMLDCELFGLDAGWHHLTNVWLHALSGILLFIVLARMTGSRWPSAAVALLFLLHPLHVESVAWIAERKEVLSSVFWFASIWADVRWVDRPSIGRYAVLAAAFACGLMSKPMIVTLPFVLVLLDAWPLRRFTGAWNSLGGLVREKLPLIAMAAAASAVTYVAQRTGGAMADAPPLITRLMNVPVAYVTYILQFFWPRDLAVYYPFAENLPVWKPLLAVALLAAVSALTIWRYRTAPYLAIGWLWFLGTLVPVIGLVQVGTQSHADRYMHIPMIGLAIMLVWGTRAAIPSPAILRAAAAIAALACAVLTIVQLDYWRSTEALFRHTVAVAGPSLVAHVNLGFALTESGHNREAAEEYQLALRRRPDNALARAGLGQALANQGRVEEGIAELQAAVSGRPNFADAQFQLGSLLGRAGRVDEAIPHLAEAVHLKPRVAEFHYNLGNALAVKGRMREALNEFEEAISLDPGDALSYLGRGNALAELGRLDAAIGSFEQALRLNPRLTQARRSLDLARSLRGR
jgi:Flp pilus assembly protein TadD